jgi:hypothetical protein
MFLVLVVPTFDVSMLEWMKIPPLSWARYISALFLTSFLPGYFILKIVDRKGEIDGCAIIVLSYLLSLFLSFIAGFLILLSSNSISVLSLPVIVVINLVLLIIYYFMSQKTDKYKSLTLNSFELGIILPVFIEVMLGTLTVMLSNMPLTAGDMRQHYGFALQFSQRFPIYAGKMITYQGGYLFHIYLAVVFSLSGIPPALAEQGLYFISFMPILALYSAMKAWFPERKEEIPIIVMFLSTLLGFGSLYALYLKYAQPASSITQLLSIATYKTYDIYMRILFLPDIVAPIWNIGIPVFFILLYFLRKDTCSYTKKIIVPILIALGWLGHIAEPIIFIFILLVYTLFLRQSRGERLSPYVILGLFLVAIVDLVAPAQIYLRSVKETFSIPFFASLSLLMLIIIIEMIEDKFEIYFLANIKNFISKKLEVFWRFGRWILLYAYFFSFIVWLAVEKNFNLWKWGGSYVPFFVFPLRFGAVGLLIVISVFLYFTKIIRDRVLLFFLMFIPLGFTLEQAASYGLLPYYPAYRYATLTFVGALVIAAFGIINLIKSVSKSIRLTVVLCIILTALMISSQLSTSLYYVNASYYSKYAKILQDELDALDYICQHLPQNSSVLTFTMDSANKLRNFAAVNAVQDAQRWSNLILSTSNPYIITYVLGSSNVKYIFMSQKDAKLIRSNRVLASMINYFPKVFENDHVTIYEVPSLTPPSSTASLGVLYISPLLQQSGNNVWIDDSFTEGWYPYRHYGKIKSYGWEVKNGILTISVTSNQSGNVWVSYAYSGLKLNTSVYSVLAFRYRVENDYTWFTLQLWNSSNKIFFYIGHQTDREFTTKIFTLPENQMITRIEIIVETVEGAPAGTTARAYVDYIEIAKGPFDSVDVLPALLVASLQSKYSFLYVDDTLLENLRAYLSHYSRIILTSDPKISVRDLLSWVSSGGKIVVFNTHGNGFFANLLEIDKSNTSLTVRNYGLGKIAYINLEKVDKQSNIIIQKLAKEIRQFLELDEYPHKIDVLPVYNSTFGNIKIFGDLKLLTDVLRLRGPIILINSPFKPNEIDEIKIYGKVALTIKNASLLISPSESYLVIESEGYPIEGEVLVKAPNTLIIINKNILYNVSTLLNFKFRSTNIFLSARLPLVNAFGNITFDKLDVHEALYVPLAGIVQQKAKVEGQVEFDTAYISNPLVIFSSFKVNGKILNLDSIATPIIPWSEVLSSSYNLAFNIIFSLSIIFYIFKKRNAKQAITQEENGN